MKHIIQNNANINFRCTPICWAKQQAVINHSWLQRILVILGGVNTHSESCSADGRLTCAWLPAKWIILSDLDPGAIDVGSIVMFSLTCYQPQATLTWGKKQWMQEKTHLTICQSNLNVVAQVNLHFQDFSSLIPTVWSDPNIQWFIRHWAPAPANPWESKDPAL